MPGPVTLAVLATAAMLSVQDVEATPRLRSADVRITRRGALHRSVGRRRRPRGDADQRRDLRGHARTPLSDRRQLDLDLVRRLVRLVGVGDLRGAQTPSLWR